MFKIVFFIISFFLLSNNIYCQTNLNKAYQAMWAVDINEAEKMYFEILNNNQADNGDRVSAANWLIYLTGKFRNDFSKANQIAETAFKLKNNESSTYNLLAYIYNENKSYDSALFFTSKSLQKAKTYNDSFDIYLRYSTIVLLKSIETFTNKKELDLESVQNAIALLSKFELNNSENFDLNYNKIGLCMLSKQGNEVLSAWKRFFQATDSVPKYLKTAYSELSSVLQSWNGEKLETGKIKTLIQGLAHSRLYNFAEMVYKYLCVDTNLSADTEIREILAYCKFINEWKENTYVFYRKVILDKKQEDIYQKEYKKQIQNLKETFWNTLTGKSFSQSKFDSEISKKFGTKYMYPIINGYTGFLCGHIIYEDNRSIEQYGKKAEAKFYFVDMIYSNDLKGYFTGRYTIPGWANHAENHEIIQMRQQVSSKGFMFYKNMSDSVLHNNWIASINKKIKQNESADSKEVLSNLYGFCEKMRYDVIKLIYDSIKAKCKSPQELKIKFVNTVNQMEIDALYHHESRHVLDRKYKPFIKQADREFNAKLSEIAFCKYPSYFLGFYLGYNPKSTDPHSKAETKFTIEINDWLKQHKHEIKNFDTKKPAIQQIHLLTKQQIIEAVRSIDNWSKN